MWVTPITDRTSEDVAYLVEVTDRISRVGWENASIDDKYFWYYGTGSTSSITLIDGILYTSDGLELRVFSDRDIVRGAWNISDVNRIIDNTIYLKNILISLNYSVPFSNQPKLTESDIPYITSVVKVLKDNVMTIVNLVGTMDNPIINYNDYIGYEDANSIEINLNISDQLIKSTIKLAMYCGRFVCGQETSVL